MVLRPQEMDWVEPVCLQEGSRQVRKIARILTRICCRLRQSPACSDLTYSGYKEASSPRYVLTRRVQMTLGGAGDVSMQCNAWHQHQNLSPCDWVETLHGCVFTVDRHDMIHGLNENRLGPDYVMFQLCDFSHALWLSSVCVQKCPIGMTWKKVAVNTGTGGSEGAKDSGVFRMWRQVREQTRWVIQGLWHHHAFSTLTSQKERWPLPDTSPFSPSLVPSVPTLVPASCPTAPALLPLTPCHVVPTEHLDDSHLPHCAGSVYTPFSFPSLRPDLISSRPHFWGHRCMPDFCATLERPTTALTDNLCKYNSCNTEAVQESSARTRIKTDEAAATSHAQKKSSSRYLGLLSMAFSLLLVCWVLGLAVCWRALRREKRKLLVLPPPSFLGYGTSWHSLWTTVVVPPLVSAQFEYVEDRYSLAEHLPAATWWLSPWHVRKPFQGRWHRSQNFSSTPEHR